MNTDILKNELQYRTARSGGKGGQNVNKVETKVEILFDVAASAAFTEAEKQLIFNNLANKINKDGILQVTHQTERSQLSNKQLAEKKLFSLLKNALVVEIERKLTLTPPSVIAHRKVEKRRTGEKKATRRKVKSDDDGFDLFL